MLVHRAPRRARLAGRPRDVEQDEHAEVAPPPHHVDVDRFIRRRAGGPSTCASTAASMSMSMPCSCRGRRCQLYAQPRQGSAQRVRVGASERASVAPPARSRRPCTSPGDSGAGARPTRGRSIPDGLASAWSPCWRRGGRLAPAPGRLPPRRGLQCVAASAPGGPPVGGAGVAEQPLEQAAEGAAAADRAREQVERAPAARLPRRRARAGARRRSRLGWCAAGVRSRAAFSRPTRTLGVGWCRRPRGVRHRLATRGDRQRLRRRVAAGAIGDRSGAEHAGRAIPERPAPGDLRSQVPGKGRPMPRALRQRRPGCPSREVRPGLRRSRHVVRRCLGVDEDRRPIGPGGRSSGGSTSGHGERGPRWPRPEAEAFCTGCRRLHSPGRHLFLPGRSAQRGRPRREGRCRGQVRALLHARGVPDRGAPHPRWTRAAARPDFGRAALVAELAGPYPAASTPSRGAAER